MSKIQDLASINTAVTWAAKTSNGRVYLFEAPFGHSRPAALRIAEAVWDMEFVTVWHLESARETLAIANKGPWP